MDNKKNEEDLVILFEMNINSDRSYVGTAERNFFLILHQQREDAQHVNKLTKLFFHMQI